MKKLVVACAAVALCASAFAVDYTWNGGTSGEWTTAANWTPSTGYPNDADDTAAFASAATVSVGDAVAVKGISAAGELTLTGAEIALGADGIQSSAAFGVDVTVNNGLTISAAQTIVSNQAAAVHLKGVVAGAGGILKGGAGRLHLYSANTFEGGLVATGTKKTPKGNDVGSSGYVSGGAFVWNSDVGDSSGVVIYDVQALGAGKATFDPDYKSDDGSGARLTVMNCTGTVENDIRLANDKTTAKTYYALEVSGGDVVFSGKITSTYRTIVRLLSVNTVHFSQAIGHSNYLTFVPLFSAAAPST